MRGGKKRVTGNRAFIAIEWMAFKFARSRLIEDRLADWLIHIAEVFSQDLRSIANLQASAYTTRVPCVAVVNRRLHIWKV